MDYKSLTHLYDSLNFFCICYAIYLFISESVNLGPPFLLVSGPESVDQARPYQRTSS